MQILFMSTGLNFQELYKCKGPGRDKLAMSCTYSFSSLPFSGKNEMIFIDVIGISRSSLRLYILE